MLNSPVDALICRLAVPTIISNLITTLYTVANIYYIGKMNTSASAAIGVVYSLMAIIQAVGFFFGQGSGNNISAELGRRKTARPAQAKRDMDEAAKLAAISFFSALIAGFVIACAGLLFLEPLALLLGSTGSILPYSVEYMRFILIGAPFMAGALVLNNLLRFEGKAFFGMIGLGVGAVLNIGLAPLLIFVCELGIAGAALATIASQFVSFCLLLFGCQKMTAIPLRLANFRPSVFYFKIISRGGTPSFFRQGVTCIATICLNVAARPFGDAAISAMAIVVRLTNVANFGLIGFGQAFQPVCGFNYGARRLDRVRHAFRFCIQVTTAFLLVLAVLGFIFAHELIAIFRRGDIEVIVIGALALRLQCLTLPLLSWTTISNMLMQTTGRVVRATVLGVARQGIFLIPAVLLLPRLIGILGIQAAQPIAGFLSFLLAVPLQLDLMRRLDRERRRDDAGDS